MCICVLKVSMFFCVSMHFQIRFLTYQDSKSKIKQERQKPFIIHVLMDRIRDVATIFNNILALTLWSVSNRLSEISDQKLVK